SCTASPGSDIWTARRMEHILPQTTDAPAVRPDDRARAHLWQRSGVWFEWVVFISWCAIVLGVAARHEFWRDEVRALSLSIDARTPLDLPALLRNEGHPILWYLVLWAGYRLAGSPVILPAAAFVVAAAAVFLFVQRAPLHRALKVLF